MRKIICSFPRQSDSHIFDALYRAGGIELEVVPQGNLAERIRAAGAGIGAFFTPTGYGTLLAEGKETRRIEGRDYVLEYPIHADVALMKAYKGDRWGNLVYRKTARNFGPIMATAAKTTIAQVEKFVELGALDPGGHRDARHFTSTGSSRSAATREPRHEEDSTATPSAAASRETYPTAPMSISASACRRWVAIILPADREIVLHTENGLLGMGPAPADDEIDTDLINAGKQPVTALTGASYFHHADSFAMMRGGHLDICVLGAFQVSVKGDLANWHTGAPDAIPAVGGAMDLAVGAKQVFVMMEHVSKSGESKIVERCAYPLTGIACVSRIYTDLAVIDVTREGLLVRDILADCTFDELQRLTGAPLRAG